MAKIDIPHLVIKRRGARMHHYWQPSATLKAAGWKSVALGMDPRAAQAAAQAHNDKVEAWRNGGERPRAVRKFLKTGTVDQLIRRFEQEHLPTTRASTQREYKSKLRTIGKWAGGEQASHITIKSCEALKKALLRPSKDGQLLAHRAAGTLRVLRTLLQFAERIDAIPRGSNPMAHVTIENPKGRKRLWELDDDGAFIAAALALNLPSVALAAELAVYSAQRQADLIAFTENQLQEIHLHDPGLTKFFADKDGAVRGWQLEQEKTETPIGIPFDPVMLGKIEKALKRNRARDRAAGRLITHVLVDDRSGMPFTEHGFIRAWQGVLEHAIAETGRTQMTGLHFRDFRRTRVVRLRRKGFNREQIASVTGHSPKSIDAMLEVYGPIDPTMTASVIASMIGHEATAAKQRKKG